MSSKRQRPAYAPMSGIAAVLGTTKRDEVAPTETNDSIPVELIQSRKNQPRRYFDPEKLNELTQSIKEYGVLEPILLRPLPDRGEYEIIAGERRVRAAKEAGLAEVPSIILEISDQEVLKLALVENLQREDLNPIEETEGMLELLSSELGKSRKELISLFVQAGHPSRNGAGKNVFPTNEWEKVEGLFKSIGRLTPDSFRTSRLPLLNMPAEVLEAVRQGKLQYTKAREIAKVKDNTKRQKILTQAIARQWSLKEIKTQIAALKGKPPRNSMAEKLIDQFDTTFRMVKKAKGTLRSEQADRVEALLREIEKVLTEETN